MLLPEGFFFEMLSYFTEEPREKERLLEFASSQGQDELTDYCTRPKRTATEVLRDFPGVHIPLHYLLDTMPKIRPRPFSISSSQHLFPNQAHITVAIVSYKTYLKAPRIGLCTAYLASLDPSNNEDIRVNIYTQCGYITMPRDPSTPMVMVGPGTGLAIFRAFIQERKYLAEQGNNTLGEAVFYFGCRYRNKDYLYGTEWEDHVKRGHITALFVAFSRDQDQKIYVQHLMARKEHATQLWDLLANKQGCFYLSGSARRMPQDVRDAVRAAVMSEGGKSEEEAEAFLKHLEKDKRYCVETWF